MYFSKPFGITNFHIKFIKLIKNYKDKKTNFNEYLQKDNSVRVHHKNLQFLATEIFNVKVDLAPNIMKDLFQFREPLHNLCQKISTFLTRKVRTTYYDPNLVTYLAPKIL